MKTLKEIIGKKDRDVAVRLLRKVKLELYDTSWMQYVCIHLSNVVTNEREDRVSLKLRSTIQNRLGKNYGTVTAWLTGEHHIDPFHLTSRAKLEYRLRWVDSMIAELA